MKISRRSFLGTSTAAVAAGTMLGADGRTAAAAPAEEGGVEMVPVPFALQLYTVRDKLAEDVPGTLKKVKEIGYDNVELAGTWGKTPEEAKAMLGEAGLTPVSAHVGVDAVTKNPDEMIAFAKALDLKFLAMGIGRSPAEVWVNTGKALNEAGARFREEGIYLCYHNHAAEYELFDGVTGYDLLLRETAPANLGVQIDTYWVKDAGLDPAETILRYAERCRLLHVKDVTDGDPHTFAEVGQGILDWPAIFAAGAKVGAKWYTVEQDRCAVDSIESARISAEFMKKARIPAA